MAADAGPVLYDHEPVALGELRGNVAFATELARVRDLEHRIPIDGGIIFCRRGRVRRDHRFQVEGLSGRSFNLRRIDQPAPAPPNTVIGFRKIGYDVAP